MGSSAQYRLLRFFFRHLYTDLAWSYDLVAALVSVGRWREWIDVAVPFVRGPLVLELAFGTGMLQQSLRARGQWMLLGLDRSPQMVRLAARRLRRAGMTTQGLARGAAELLPYACNTFQTVVSTFPSEFIFDQGTLREIRRVLHPQGTFILLPAAWIIGQRLLERAAALLFRITRQAPAPAYAEAAKRFAEVLDQAGFRTSFQCIELRSSLVILLSASKWQDKSLANSGLEDVTSWMPSRMCP